MPPPTPEQIAARFQFASGLAAALSEGVLKQTEFLPVGPERTQLTQTTVMLAAFAGVYQQTVIRLLKTPEKGNKRQQKAATGSSPEGVKSA